MWGSAKGRACPPMAFPSTENWAPGLLAERAGSPFVGEGVHAWADLLLPARDLPAGHQSDPSGVRKTEAHRPGQEGEAQSPGGALKGQRTLSPASGWAGSQSCCTDECPTVQSLGQWLPTFSGHTP